MPDAPDSPYGALTPHQRQLVLRLLGGGAPIIIARLAAWCLHAGLVGIGTLTAPELFAGRRAITLGLRYYIYGVSCFAHEPTIWPSSKDRALRGVQHPNSLPSKQFTIQTA